MDNKKTSISTLLFIYCLLCVCTLHAYEKIEKDWVKADQKFISKVIKILKNKPLQIDIISSKEDEDEELGFNYQLKSGSHGKGYVSFFYQFIYKNKKLISYSLDPQMPENPKLIPTYKKFYQKIFQFNNNNQIKTYYYNLSEMEKPLPGLKKVIKVNKKIRHYMTPFSGVIYGLRGGYANSILENRLKFIDIKKDMNNITCFLLLNSKNPASRLTSYEYFLLNSEKFSKEEKIYVEDRMKVIFKELPNITTMRGCIVTTAKSKDLVRSIIQLRIKEK